MNFMSSGICKELITASTGIITMSSSSSSSSLQPPYIHQYNNRHSREGAAEVAVELDRDDHMLVNSSTARPTVLVMEREHMFDKVVTPSDVGKLNRLVIPKHHAEKYFPLDPTSNEKGLVLNFEDRNGKPWRFRYSYWNSSQSYVMTKGWSRFVKEKKLDAGDIVSFQRGLGNLGKEDRLFIDWRHRPDAPPLDHHLPPIILPSNINNIPYYNYNYPISSIHDPWNPTPTFSLQPSVQSSNVFSQSLSHHQYPQGSTLYLNSGLEGAAAGRRGGGGVLIPQHLGQLVEEQRRGGVVFESVPVVQGKATVKRLRLFGVNMDCPISESDRESDLMLNTTNSSTSTSTTQPQYYSKRPLHLMPLPPPFDSFSTNSFPSLQLQSNYNSHADYDKAKGSTSLDLDL